jgi:spoIIIJ-associated protein
MPPVEKTGRTVEEAIDKALEELGVDLEDIEVAVVDKGRRGILGRGAEAARVIVSLKDETEYLDDDDDNPDDDELEDDELEDDDEGEEAVDDDLFDMAKETIEELLSAMMVDASIALPQRSSRRPAGRSRGGPSADEGSGGLSFNIDGEDAGLLIGRRGETLSAMQFVVNFILSRKAQTRVNVAIDVEGYRERRYDTLRSMANRMAERATSSGRRISLEPMPARERRIIHLALSNNSRVSTESFGEGQERRVTIIPRRGGGGQPSGNRRPPGDRYPSRPPRDPGL